MYTPVWTENAAGDYMTKEATVGITVGVTIATLISCMTLQLLLTMIAFKCKRAVLTERQRKSKAKSPSPVYTEVNLKSSNDIELKRNEAYL